MTQSVNNTSSQDKLYLSPAAPFKIILFWIIFIISGIGRLCYIVVRKFVRSVCRLSFFAIVYTLMATTTLAGSLFVLGCCLLALSSMNLLLP